jgi:hypothetical protein
VLSFDIVFHPRARRVPGTLRDRQAR